MGGDCTNSAKPEMEVVMESEPIQPNREVVTVKEINEQSNTGKERITDENSRVDSWIGKVTASHDLGSNE